ncbi:SOS response-associated peptidase [Dietzia sp.]|uniref:SOS response-associated peptidase n=1 Tax=Dietzia sp. TaxID=1871616 RepID=UPI002FD99050
MSLMCGRYSLQSDPAQLALELDAVDLASAPPAGALPASGARSPRFNIAPTTTIPVLTESVQDGAGAKESGRELRAMRWGLIPSWTKDRAKLPTLFNARSETAATKPSFRSAVRRRHAVVPMDGWYEWVPVPPSADAAGAGAGKKTPKQPFFMSLPGDEGLHMAALWESWEVPESELDDFVDAPEHHGESAEEPDLFAHADGDLDAGESGRTSSAGADAPESPQALERATLYSCTILTTAALGPLRAVHDRMPLVVPADRLDAWLDSGAITDPLDLVDADELAAWAERIEIRPVSRSVSSVRNDGPELLEPVAAPEWWSA